jgi:hypothetical protein
MERHFRTIPLHDVKVTNWRRLKGCFNGAEATLFLMEFLRSRPEERFNKAERTHAEKIGQKLIEQNLFVGVNGYANFIDSDKVFYRLAANDQAEDTHAAAPAGATPTSAEAATSTAAAAAAADAAPVSPKRPYKRASDGEDLENDSPSSKKSSLLKRGSSLRGSISRGMSMILKNSTLRRGKRVDRSPMPNFGIQQPREFPTPLRNILNSTDSASAVRTPERSPMQAWGRTRGAYYVVLCAVLWCVALLCCVFVKQPTLITPSLYLAQIHPSCPPARSSLRTRWARLTRR